MSERVVLDCPVCGGDHLMVHHKSIWWDDPWLFVNEQYDSDALVAQAQRSTVSAHRMSTCSHPYDVEMVALWAAVEDRRGRAFYSVESGALRHKISGALASNDC